MTRAKRKEASTVRHTQENREPVANPCIQTGLDRFRSLIQAWDWHIGLGRECESREPIDRTIKEDVLEAFDATETHRSKKYRILRTITLPCTHPVWEDLLIVMVRWALLVEVFPPRSGIRIAAASAIIPRTHEMVEQRSSSDGDGELLRAFLIHMANAFPWLHEEWHFPDPTSARRKWLQGKGYREAAWFKTHFGLEPERIRAATRRDHGLIRFRVVRGRREYLTSDVARYAPEEFRLDVLQVTFGTEFPNVAKLPKSRRQAS